jgi:hypothetical protein
VDSIRKCFSKEGYCGKLWDIDKTQSDRNKNIPCTRVAIITSLVFFILSIVFCALSLQYHRPLNTYLILFGVCFGCALLPLLIRTCCMEPPKAMPKKEPEDSKKGRKTKNDGVGST